MTQALSKERLEEIAAHEIGSDAYPRRAEWQAMARALLAAHEQEPFMYGISDPDGKAHIDEFCVCAEPAPLEDSINELNYDREEGDGLNYAIVPLYTHPAPSIPAAVPNGWPEKLTWSHHDDMTQAEVVAWNNAVDACRDAMLQSEPVKQQVTLREGIQALRDLGGINAEKILAEREALNDCTDDEHIMAIEGISVVKLPPEFYSNAGRVVQIEKVMAALAVAGIEYERPQNEPQNIPEIIPQWIPVSERLPSESDIILVAEDGHFVCEAQYRGDSFYSTARGMDDFFETECRDVAHWQPLPAAPKGV